MVSCESRDFPEPRCSSSWLLVSLFRAVLFRCVYFVSEDSVAVVALRSGPPALAVGDLPVFLKPVVSFTEGCRLRCLRGASGFHGALRVARLFFLNRLLFGRAVG